MREDVSKQKRRAARPGGVNEVNNAHTFLEGLEALKGNLKFIFIGEFGGIVQDIHSEKRHNRHLDSGYPSMVSVGQMCWCKTVL